MLGLAAREIGSVSTPRFESRPEDKKTPSLEAGGWEFRLQSLNGRFYLSLRVPFWIGALPPNRPVQSPNNGPTWIME